MAKAQEPLPVKLFTAILFSEEEKLQRARAELVRLFGDIDYTSAVFPFMHSAYYAAEMGVPISRVIFSYAALIDPAALADIKTRTNRIEQSLAVAGARRVNIDPGYLDFGKVVLASNKPNNQKIYLGQGVYADINLFYEKGNFRSFEWTFPDFRSGIYKPALLTIRARYKAALRAGEGLPAPGAREPF